MSYRKIIMAVQCDTEEEKEQIQRIAEDISRSFKIKAKDVIKIYPLFQKNSSLIINSMRTISANGMKGIAQVVPSLIKNFKR
jgi:hypothetical protein